MKIAKRSGFGKAQVAVARKLSVLLGTMWIKGQDSPDARRDDSDGGVSLNASRRDPLDARKVVPARDEVRQPRLRAADVEAHRFNGHRVPHCGATLLNEHYTAAVNRICRSVLLSSLF